MLVGPSILQPSTRHGDATATIRSGFDETSTASDVLAGIDLSGKTAIVTGGYSGIGTETTRALRHAGARVIVPVRDRAKAAASLARIDAFARRFLASNRPLQILINSAGIMATPLSRDAKGHELQFATNHLGHFRLTARLWPALIAARRCSTVDTAV